MTANEFRLYLIFVACFMAALGIVNLLRPHKRWLGAGSVFLSLATVIYLSGFPLGVVAATCGMAVFCMFRDVGTRIGRKA